MVLGLGWWCWWLTPLIRVFHSLPHFACPDVVQRVQRAVRTKLGSVHSDEMSTWASWGLPCWCEFIYNLMGLGGRRREERGSLLEWKPNTVTINLPTCNSPSASNKRTNIKITQQQKKITMQKRNWDNFGVLQGQKIPCNLLLLQRYFTYCTTLSDCM